jgi:cell wall-associated NlpC family hydrolase
MKFNSAITSPLARRLLFSLLALSLGGCASTMPERPSKAQMQLERKLATDKQTKKTTKARLNANDLDDRRLQLIGEALSMIGIPYVYGGTSPDKGFDCSGLVQYSLNNVGVLAPRTAAAQRSNAHTKPVDDLLPGDLIFFRIDRSTNHVGIYLGGGEFIHAPRTGSNVRLESLHKRYWQRRFTGVGSYL